MVLWHAGLAAAITYATLGRRRIDYRFILLGAIAPDVVDGILSVTLFPEWRGRGIAHSVLAVVVVAVAVLLTTRGTARLAWFGLAVGWVLHLVGDGIWDVPETFLWPAFGWGFAVSPEPYSWALITDAAAHWRTWAAELIGVALLAWFWVAFELGRDGRARAFLSDGHLRA
ncbi:MAG: metal-dependent hydrolase [Actinomycetota bacterium]|nr:metal-dependent hydrolase [Actinomycetota bacterium]